MNPRDKYAEAVRRKHLETGHISPDHYRERFGRYQFDQHEEDDVWAWSLQDWHDALASGRFAEAAVMAGAPGSGKTTLAAHMSGEHAIFDSVAASPRTRRRILDAMPPGTPSVHAHVMLTPLGMCLARNSKRADTREVPAKVVQIAWHVIHDSPPTHAEGFAKIITYTPGDEP